MTEKTKAEALSEEFKALLDKYNCEVVLHFRASSNDTFGWNLEFRELKQDVVPTTTTTADKPVAQ